MINDYIIIIIMIMIMTARVELER